MKFCVYIVFVVFISLVSACGGGGSGQAGDQVSVDDDLTDDSGGEETGFSITNATWRLCNEFNATSSSSDLIFEGDTFAIVFSLYENSDCSGSPSSSSEINAGTFELGDEERTSPTGFLIRDLDFNVTALLGAELPAGDQEPFTNFDVVSVSGDTLFLSTLAGLDEESRPEDVDSDQPYIRQ